MLGPHVYIFKFKHATLQILCTQALLVILHLFYFSKGLSNYEWEITMTVMNMRKSAGVNKISNICQLRDSFHNDDRDCDDDRDEYQGWRVQV